jgi:hypothetical protein
MTSRYGPKAFEPSQGPLHNPSARLVAGIRRRADKRGFTNFSDMWDIIPIIDGHFACWIVIPFVKAQIFFLAARKQKRAMRGGGLQSGPKKLAIVNISSTNDYSQRSSMAFDNKTYLGAWFCSIRGIGADGGMEFFFTKTALTIEPSALCHSHSTPPKSWQRPINSDQMLKRAPLFAQD